MNILFVDQKSSTPYDSAIMRREAVGGTEASLVTVAEGLAATHRVAVVQLGRQQPVEFSPSLRYLPLHSPHPFGNQPADAVVILRRIRAIPAYRRRFPQARIHVWLHNWQRPEVVLKRGILARNHCSLITVSDALLQDTDRLINGWPARLLVSCIGAGGRVPIRRIYNPVDIKPPAEPVNVDHDRLIFFSTANKGLKQVLEAFATVHAAFPTMRLEIAGSTQAGLQKQVPDCTRRPGINFLGRIPRQELLARVQTSLCVFYPQATHPETFGLVFAEANAVGTPVLAHDFGSAAEILQDPAQLVNAHDHTAILERIKQWRSGDRPQVGRRDEFRPRAVINQWRQLLEIDQPPARKP
ncbi:MAG: glycosyltransferase [Desulfurivibrio sp.]|nr:glycosyltransferase [Desulfurivibrio sp.]